MRLIKIAMKYVADNKNTTPDVARRDLENNGFLEVTRNLRSENNKNANNIFRLTEKFFLYYALFRIKHEKTILVGQEHQGEDFKTLQATENIINIRLEKINFEKPTVEPVEKKVFKQGKKQQDRLRKVITKNATPSKQAAEAAATPLKLTP